MFSDDDLGNYDNRNVNMGGRQSGWSPGLSANPFQAIVDFSKRDLRQD